MRQRKARSTTVDSTAAQDDHDHHDTVEPLDESDQARIVQQFQTESLQQQESLEQLFRHLCRLIMVLLLLSTLYLDQYYILPLSSSTDTAAAATLLQPWLRPLSMAHGVCAATLHGLSPQLMQSSPRDESSGGGSTPSIHRMIRYLMVLDATCAVAALWACRRAVDYGHPDNTDDTALLLLRAHQAMLLSNLVVVGAALYLQWDNQATQQALQNLAEAQYRYKSL